MGQCYRQLKESRRAAEERAVLLEEKERKNRWGTGRGAELRPARNIRYAQRKNEANHANREQA
jgi:hypothetical protein